LLDSFIPTLTVKFLISFSLFFTDVVRFDNTYSWTRAKEVYYSVQLLPPDTKICNTTPDEIADEVRRMSVTSKESVTSDDSFHSTTSKGIQDLQSEVNMVKGQTTTV